MKTEKQIRIAIKDIEGRYKEVLTGSFATVQVNAPRALTQLAVVTELKVLHWVLGTEYKSKLKGTNT